VICKKLLTAKIMTYETGTGQQVAQLHEKYMMMMMMNYDILLSKMKFYGISGVTNKLMESYLRNRYQRVVINAHNNPSGYFSRWEEVQHRSPQGSVLGPLLFLIILMTFLKA